MYRFLDIEELLQMNLLKTELGRRIEVLNIYQNHFVDQLIAIIFVRLSFSECTVSNVFCMVLSMPIQEESGAIVRTKGSTLGFYETLGMLMASFTVFTDAVDCTL